MAKRSGSDRRDMRDERGRGFGHDGSFGQLRSAMSAPALKVEDSRPPSRYRTMQPFADVVNLFPNTRTLIVGTNRYFPLVKQFVRDVEFVTRRRDVDQIARSGETYDRVLVFGNPDQSLVDAAVALLELARAPFGKAALVAWFLPVEERVPTGPADLRLLGDTVEAMGLRYDEAWEFTCDLGPVVVAVPGSGRKEEHAEIAGDRAQAA